MCLSALECTGVAAALDQTLHEKVIILIIHPCQRQNLKTIKRNLKIDGF